MVQFQDFNLGGFKLLKGLYLFYNQLSGPISAVIGDGCGKVEHLDLFDNYLSEYIPKIIGNFRELKILLLYFNALQYLFRVNFVN